MDKQIKCLQGNLESIVLICSEHTTKYSPDFWSIAQYARDSLEKLRQIESLRQLEKNGKIKPNRKKKK